MPWLKVKDEVHRTILICEIKKVDFDLMRRDVTVYGRQVTAPGLPIPDDVVDDITGL